MKRKHTPEAIVRLLRDVQAQLAAGASMRDLARQNGVNPGTLCRWLRRYGGVQVDEARRLVMLERENVRLKRIVAELELELDKSILNEALRGKDCRRHSGAVRCGTSRRRWACRSGRRAGRCISRGPRSATRCNSATGRWS